MPRLAVRSAELIRLAGRASASATAAMVDSRRRDVLADGKSAGSGRRRAPTNVESAFMCCSSWPSRALRVIASISEQTPNANSGCCGAAHRRNEGDLARPGDRSRPLHPGAQRPDSIRCSAPHHSLSFAERYIGRGLEVRFERGRPFSWIRPVHATRLSAPGWAGRSRPESVRRSRSATAIDNGGAGSRCVPCAR